MQGSWQFVSLSIFGKEPPGDLLTKVRVVIDGTKFTMKPGVVMTASTEKPEGEWALGAKDGDRFTFELDASSKPKTIDITVEFGDQKATLKGIYTLDGDELKICFGQERPKEFPKDAGAGTILYVLKRDKKK
jgi:uncharacterized protein (TIGR03067 family)